MRLTGEKLKKEWGGVPPRPVYYLSGPETAMKESLLKFLLSNVETGTFNLSVHSADSADIAAVVTEAFTSPMLSDKRYLILKRAEKLKKDGAARITDYLSAPSECTCFILLGDMTGKTTGRKADPFEAALCREGASVDFPVMDEAEAASYFIARLGEKNIKSGPAAVQILIETIGTSSAALDSETEKISLYLHGRKNDFDEDDAAAMAGFSKKLKPFALAGAVRAGNVRAASSALADMLRAGEDPVGILVQISGTVENLLKAKRLSSSGRPQTMPEWFSMGARGNLYYETKAAANYTESRLREAQIMCLKAEAELKSSGGRAPALVIRELILGIFGG